MKKILFLVGILFCFVFPIADASAANETIYSGIYQRLSTGIDNATAARLGAIFQTEPQAILDFIYRGITIKNDQDIENICRYFEQKELPPPSAGSGPERAIPHQQKQDCMAELRAFWAKERETVELEFFTIQQSIGLSRWWDGTLQSTDDFDILTDIQVLNHQFFGKNSTLVDPPKPSALTRQEFSLAEHDYRLPMDALSFRSSGGCDAGEISLYNGLICLPRFCTDIVCVKIKPIPGRRAVKLTGNAREATVQNLVNDLETVALRLYDSRQLTPTRNTNQAHWWSQMFNWDQLLRSNLRMESRPVPLLEEFVPSDPQAQTRKEYEYSYDLSTGFSLQEKTQADKPAEEKAAEQAEQLSGEAAEQADMKKKIYDELKNVRGELGVCEGIPNCKSKDILDIFVRDCSLMAARFTVGETDINLDACVRDFQKTATEDPLEDLLSKRLAAIGQKQDFDKNVTDQLGTLSRNLNSLYATLTGIDICTLRQAQNSCGTSKNRCTR